MPTFEVFNGKPVNTFNYIQEQEHGWLSWSMPYSIKSSFSPLKQEFNLHLTKAEAIASFGPRAFIKPLEDLENPSHPDSFV